MYLYEDDFSGAQVYLRARSGKQKKNGAQNQSQCACLIEKQLETVIFVLYSLNSACSFHF